MAKMTVTDLDRITDNLNLMALTSSDKIIEALEESAEAVLPVMKSALESVIKNKDKATGELVGLIGITKVSKSKDENYNIKIGFANKKINGVKAARIASFIEHGRSKVEARPWIGKARRQVAKKIEEVLRRKLGEITGD